MARICIRLVFCAAVSALAAGCGCGNGGGSTDGGAGDSGPAPVEAALLLDFDMRHPIIWSFLISELEALGYDVEYRRWFPHVTVADVSPDDTTGRIPYRLLIVAAGGGPGRPTERMREAEMDNLLAQVFRDGTLVLLSRNSWRDGYGGENEWFYFNRFLESQGLPLRIDRNTVVGDVAVPVGAAPPLHLAGPSGYPGSLEWTLLSPVGYPDADHPATATLGGAPFAFGLVPSVACNADTIEVLAWTHASAILWHRLDPASNQLELPVREVPVAVMADTGAASGAVAIVPQSLVQLPAHTESASDKPVLDLALLDGSADVTRAILAHIAAADRDPSTHAPQGCFFHEGLFSTVGDGFPALGGGEQIPALYPPSRRKLDPAPPEPPAGVALSESVPTLGGDPSTIPDWFVGSKARLAYGGFLAYAELFEYFDRGMNAGNNAFVVTIPAEWLADFDPAAGAPPFADAVQAAEDTGATLFLGVGYQGLYGPIAAAAGVVLGPLGEPLTAAPPLSDALWDSALTPVFEGAARAAAAYPAIRGVSMDLELYGAEMIWYSQGHAFDDGTWARMVSAIDAVAPMLAATAASLPVDERLPWLVDQGLTGVAFTALEDAVAARAATLRDQVRALAPDLELAFYAHAIALNWIYRGFMRGFGTPERPVIFLSYDIATNGARELLEAEGIPVRVLGGLLGVRFNPIDFEAALYNTAARSDGYWLFQYGDFPANAGPNGAMGRHGHPDEYWDAITSVNDRL